MTAVDYVTKSDLTTALSEMEGRLVKTLGQMMDQKISSAVDEMADIFSDGLQMVSDRFDAVDMRLDGLENRVRGLESRMGSLEGKVDDLQTVVIRMDNKLNDSTERLDEHAAKLRLIQRKVA